MAYPTFPNHLDTDEQARRLIAIAIGRQATRFVVPATTARIRLTDAQLKDGLKARIVGKEGRNVRAFEEKSGAELLLNEEPDTVVVSSLDPFRREVARLALEALVADGRIQIARIEECLEDARAAAETQARAQASLAVQELGMEGFHPAVMRVLGTLMFRTSFGQNQLAHSVETAWLCGSLAAEMGYDVALARRAGLLHDLGKALDQTKDGGHSRSGAEFAQKYGEKPEIVQAIAAHHEEVPLTSWLDHLVIAADAISGARPGARPGSTKNGLDRAQAMEQIAMSVQGVKEAFAVRAGRELRVFVDVAKVSDEDTAHVACLIAREIEAQVRFPGQIKITVLREMRVTEIAEKGGSPAAGPAASGKGV